VPLHPQAEELRRERVAAGMRPLYELSVAEARAEHLARIRADAGHPERVSAVIDRSPAGPAGQVPIRIYLPTHTGPLPVLVYLHGGGWVLGTLESADAICRCLANATPCAVVAVDYRLAPEHRFPAALDDCYAVTWWVASHADELGLDARRLAVGGDSAGGNLAAAVTQLAQARGGPSLAFQLLVYPALQHGADTASMRESSDPSLFDRASAAWCWSHYLADAVDGNSPLASPLRASDLRGLPPALVLTAEYDPLRDEGERYAERLAAAGVAAETIRFEGMAHGFFGLLGRLDAASEAHTVAASRLREAFAG
jgi:acetyl esterase